MHWFTKQLLKSRSVAARRRAVHELCGKLLTDPRAADLMLTYLEDRDAEVRCVALTAIGKSDDPRRAEAIRQTLTDADPSVRNAAILAAKRVRDEAVTAGVANLLKDPDQGVRGSAALMLETLGWRPANSAEELGWYIARGQLQRAATLGSAAIEPLELILNSGPVALRAKAVDALGRIDDERVLKPILAALDSSETQVCVAAADVICKIGNPDLADALVPLLKHQEQVVRTTAVDTLGKLGAKKHWKAIADVLKDTHWDARRAAADALARFRLPETAPALADALSDADSDVRESCALALAALRERCAIAPLVLALKDPVSSVRRIVAGALARIDADWSSAPEAQPALAQFKAAEASRLIGPRRRTGAGNAGQRSVSDSGNPATAAVAEPDNTEKHAVTLFMAVLNDSDRDLRQAAVEALARLGGQRAEAALNRAVRDADAGVQLAAERALKNFNPTQPSSPAA